MKKTLPARKARDPDSCRVPVNLWITGTASRVVFNKILIANRGEIACRVMRTCKRLGIATVAVYSDADRHALHMQTADEAVHIGPAKAAESYLNMDHILTAVKQTGAQAIHPGYGFLSENSEFARRCKKAGIVFIGPSPESMDAMASKSAAKALMERAGVPVVPGYHGKEQSLKKLEAEAGRIGFPLMIKATAGGGGKGMRVVHDAREFKDALDGAKREAKSAFDDDHVLLEKYIRQPRHIEFQVFGDRHGNVVHMFERECSLQRRFQKVLEETPSPFLDEVTRKKMGEAAVAAARAVNYMNAGTIEFIVGVDKSFHFMEMNTRLQVEHPITEEITGLDLVEWQLRVAAGEKLPLSQNQIRQHGHAIEVRLYAENADKGFLPVTGRIEAFTTPNDDCVRADTGVRSGDEISIFYDPMIAKISVHGKDRAEAIRNLRQALAETAVFGLITNLPLLRGIARHPDFSAGKFDTGFIGHELKTLLARPAISPPVIAAALAYELSALDCTTTGSPWTTDGWRLADRQGLRFLARGADGSEHAIHVSGNAHAFTFALDGAIHEVRAEHLDSAAWTLTLEGKAHRAEVFRHGAETQVAFDAKAYNFMLTSPYAPKAGHAADEAVHPLSPMPGRVVAVHVKAGDKVEPGQSLMVLEGMKMEYTVKAGVAGSIEKLLYKEGDTVDADAILADIKASDA
ncbi:MAG: acetyl/propionyl/methylcrotonyl-CoA carboxylase subunit alpha [Gammaproteobacteria bacterium]|nr:acetyl/propionyl/methylcrotonyl-CoA carboxylase subunit alpha [Gammaproteobacteria bacterium]